MLAWFEIPVLDMDRAKKFYETVFKIQIQVEEFGNVLMGWFPFAEGKPGAPGSLVKHDGSYIPSETHGSVLYFSSNDVAVELSRVTEAGGKVLQEKTKISDEIGYMAMFLDTEGNRLALYSNP